MEAIRKLSLRCDTRTGKHTLLVEYSSPSGTPMELHEEEHQHLLRQALRALWGRDEVPEGVEVEYHRLPCPEASRPVEVPVPDPMPPPMPSTWTEKFSPGGRVARSI